MASRGYNNKATRDGMDNAKRGSTYPKWGDEYENKVEEYLEKAFATAAQGDQIQCPCKHCDFRYWFRRNVVREHVICNGHCLRVKKHFDSEMYMDQDRMTLDHGASFNVDGNGNILHDFMEGPNEEATKFFKLVEDGKEELYPGCKKFTKLSFTVRLFLFKSDHKLSNAAFVDLLELIKAVQPDAQLPASFNEAKNVIKVLGLDYTKIDACPNDCMLYWEEHADATSCYKCGTSRWKSDDKDEVTLQPYRVPAKILRYFPPKRRLQRLYMCEETARYMIWHAKGRLKDGLLRHPADGKAWKDFDLLYPNFAKDPRNVRLGLATDGFNPFQNMGIVHTTWPVILVNYNLPPWLCTKPEFFMLALLISGPRSPTNDIDVYLQPLIKDLKEMWLDGVETYDALSKQRFNMRVALMSTINDFPAYAMMSGWSTKGKTACPCCHYETSSTPLKFSNKKCYMGHRRFLDVNHPWRRDKKHFNGEVEDKMAPIRLSGTEIEELLADFKNDFGKGQKKKKKSDPDHNPWRKKNILSELPYWKHNNWRHNLDVMHIEKNVFDKVIGTLLDISKKTKVNMKSRQDLKDLKMRPELQPKESENGRLEIAKSRFWMSVEEKRLFCQVIKNSKFPHGSASNISRCVNIQERKIAGYKSHDAHFMMQNLLPIAVSTTLPNDVALPLIRLCAFFKAICSKVIDPNDLDDLQSSIVQTLCELEMLFPPSFFDITVHLPIHLVEEIELGGPISARCMYAIERYLKEMKSNVGNKSRPEGSMAEAYLMKECMNFCTRYFKQLRRIDEELKRSKNKKVPPANQTPVLFPKSGHPLKGRGRTTKKKRGVHRIDLITWAQAHQYVVFNCHCEEVERYINEHKTFVANQRKRKWDNVHNHSKDFVNWLKEEVETNVQKGQQVTDHIRWLSVGPSFIARRYTGYFINGYRYHTMARDANLVTQNSGVTLTALMPSFSSRRDQNPIIGDVAYYGLIEDIIEIYYHGDCSVVLFKCLWFHSETDNYGLTSINRNKCISKGEPFILASQAHQVFYVENPTRKDWHYCVKGIARGLYDEEPEEETKAHKSKSVARENVPEYERQRLQKLKNNAERMKQHGLGSLASKILEAKYDTVARNILDTEVLTSSDEEIEYEEINETGNLSHHSKVQASTNGLCRKGSKPPLMQSIPMADMMKLRSQKKFQKQGAILINDKKGMLN